MSCVEDPTLIQAEFVRLMTQSGQCLRAGQTGDGMGGYDVSAGWVATGIPFACLATQHGSVRGDTQEGEAGGHLLSMDSWDLMTPVDVLLRLRDRVRVDDVITLEVNGSDRGKGLNWNIIYSCSLVTGDGEAD